MNKSNIISGFAGENRVAPSFLIPPNVSPDAENIDYLDGTLKKREGFERLTDYLLCYGGVFALNTSASGVTFPEADYDLTDLWWTIELLAQPFWKGTLSAAKHPLFMSTDAKPRIEFGILGDGAGNDRWYAHIWSDSGGDIYTTVYGATTPVNGVVAAVSVMFGNPTITLTVNGTVSNTDITGAFSWPATYGFNLGGQYSKVLYPPEVSYWADELRMWQRTSPYPPFVDVDALIPIATSTELPNSIIPGVYLRGYWKFNDKYGAATLADSFSTHHASITRDVYRVRGLIDINAREWPITGIVPISATDILVCTKWETYLYDVAAGTITSIDTLAVGTRLYATYNPQANHVSSATIHGHTVLVNGYKGNTKYQLGAMYQLTPDKPDASSTTATDSTTGGKPNGAYLYAFQFRNSIDGSVSERSTDIVAVTVATNKVNLSGIPTTADAQVDYVRIYRTKAKGAIFYYLDQIAAGTTTYVDNISDTDLITEYDPYVGQPPENGSFCATHAGRLFVFSGRRAYYSEITDDTNPGGFAAFYFNNYIDFEEDIEDCTGAVSVDGNLLVFKAHSLYRVSGYGQFSTFKLYEGMGCVNGATVASGDSGIYFLSPNGISIIDRALGQPVDVTGNTQRPLFEEMTDADRDTATGVYDPVRKQYRVSFVSRVTNYTMVLSEKTGAISKYTIDANAMACVYLNEDIPQLLLGVRGYLCLGNTGYGDGVQVSGELSAHITGAVKDGWTCALQSDGAPFPVSGTGYANLDVTVIHTDGTLETRRIVCNTADTLYVRYDWTVAPVAGETYHIGSYNAYWKSPAWNVDGDPGSEKILRRLRVWLRNVDGVSILETACTPDEGAEEVLADTICDLRYKELEVAYGRGREFVLEFSNIVPNESFEIEGFQFLHEEAKTR